MSDTARNINLENNMIGPAGCSFLSSMVKDNGYITDLVITLREIRSPRPDSESFTSCFIDSDQSLDL